MPYLSIKPPDHGQIDFGCHSYGGLAYRLPLQPSTSDQDHRPPYRLTRRKFITEHNLAWYLRRPGLYPRTMGFPLPLLETANDYAEGIRDRPMGMLLFDSPREHHVNRNLLAGELSKVGGLGDRVH